MRNCCLAVIAVMLLMLPHAADPAGAQQEIGLYIDGQQVDFVSQVRGGRLPSLLVDGHAMIPVRLLDEKLGGHLDLHLAGWDVYLINDIGFKLGEKVAYQSAPSIGGDAAWAQELSTAPMVIGGRMYVPAREFLEMLGLEVSWDQDQKALVIMTKKG